MMNPKHYVIRRIGGYISGDHDTPFMHPGNDAMDYEYPSLEAAEEALDIHADDHSSYIILPVYTQRTW